MNIVYIKKISILSKQITQNYPCLTCVPTSPTTQQKKTKFQRSKRRARNAPSRATTWSRQAEKIISPWLVARSPIIKVGVDGNLIDARVLLWSRTSSSGGGTANYTNTLSLNKTFSLIELRNLNALYSFLQVVQRKQKRKVTLRNWTKLH